MNRGHVPLRRCVGCRRVRPQGELLRFALDEAGVWTLDETRRRPGRGSWICHDTPACWTPKRLGRAYRAQTEAVCRALTEHVSCSELQKSQPKHPEVTPSTKPDRRA